MHDLKRRSIWFFFAPQHEEPRPDRLPQALHPATSGGRTPTRILHYLHSCIFTLHIYPAYLPCTLPEQTSRTALVTFLLPAPSAPALRRTTNRAIPVWCALGRLLIAGSIQ